MGTVDQRESFSWTQSGEYHQRCPLKTLVSCVELVGEVAEIFFECKLCFLTADLHKGETHFLEHLRSKHPQYYKQPDHIDIKPQIRHIDVNASNESTNVTATSNQNKAVAKPATVSKAPESPNGTADTYVIPSKLEVPDESDVPPQGILPLTHDLSDDDNNYGGGTDVGELSDTEMVPNLPQKDEVLTETETNQVGDGPQEADEKGLQFISEDKSEVANLNDDDEQSDEQEEVAPRRRTRSGQRKAPSKGKGKKKATPKAKPKKAAAKKRKSKIYEDEEEEEEHSDEDYEPETKDDDVTEEDDCVPGKPKKKKTKKSGEPSTKENPVVGGVIKVERDQNSASKWRNRRKDSNAHTGKMKNILQRLTSAKHSRKNPSYHRARKRFVCHVCGLKFNEKQTLIQHQSQKHNVKSKFSCKFCRLSFSTLGRLIGHQRRKHQQTEFPCDVCGRIFTQFGPLAYHMRIHEDGRERCTVCWKLTLTVKQKEIHERLHAGLEPYLCKQCGVSFMTNYALRCHELVHTGPAPNSDRKEHLCKVCGRAYKAKCDLIYHEESHNRVNTFHCPKCPKTFYFESRMNQHLRGAHVNYTCEFCGKVMNTFQWLQEHRRQHTGETIVTCDICGKSFTTKSTLTKHQRTHSNTVFKCTICDREYKIEHTFNKHVLSHKGEYPFRCEYCDRGFLNKCRMQKHIIMHHENRPEAFPFVCKRCGKKYREKEDFAVHALRHEGKNPWVCPLCAKTVSRKSYLKVHLKKYHPGIEVSLDVLKLTVDDLLKLSSDPEISSLAAKSETKSVSVVNMPNICASSETSKPFKCSGCDKRFKLIRSMRIHRENKHPYWNIAM